MAHSMKQAAASYTWVAQANLAGHRQQIHALAKSVVAQKQLAVQRPLMQNGMDEFRQLYVSMDIRLRHVSMEL